MKSIIIPVYYHRVDLYPIITTCIESFHEFKTPDCELILVDDCSPLDTIDWEDKCDVYIKKSVNTGFTNTVNTGLDAATGDVLAVVNDDVTFNEDIFKRLSEVEDGAIYLPAWAGEPQSEDDRFGFFWAITRRTQQSLGLLDENMKHYFSDLDYYMRAKAKGIEVIKWWDTPVLHCSGATYKGDNVFFNEDMEQYRKKYGRVD